MVIGSIRLVLKHRVLPSCPFIFTFLPQGGCHLLFLITLYGRCCDDGHRPHSKNKCDLFCISLQALSESLSEYFCYFHKGSFSQCLGNPMAFVSTSGYCDSKFLKFAHNSFCESMALSQYSKQQRTEYRRLATSGLLVIHACFSLIGSWGITGITRFHTRP